MSPASRFRAWSAAAFTCLAASACGLNDERYDGRADGCSGNLSSMSVLLLLDGPVTPTPTGYFGQEYPSGRNTWTVAALTDGRFNGNRLTFTVRFENGAATTSRWDVDVTRKAPNGFEGKVEIFAQSGRTYQCDITLTPASAP